jgi:hypothetical protein
MVAQRNRHNNNVRRSTRSTAVRVSVCEDGGLETSAIINILDDLDHGFSGQPMSHGDLPRPTFAILRNRTVLRSALRR